jgi:hypothetical protein
MNNEMERMWEETVVAEFEALAGIRWRLNKTTKNTS